jgi:hypothetical protein
MKTVVIGGASRSGKSLLAHAIYQATRCTVVHLDHICGAVRKAHPDKFIKRPPLDHPALLADYQAIIVRFLKNMGSEFDYVRVYESAFLDPDVVARELSGEGYISLFLGYPRVEPVRKFAELRAYGHTHPRDWTCSFPDEFLRDHVCYYTQFSAGQEELCGRLGIPFFDTSADFRGVLDAAKAHVLHRLNGAAEQPTSTAMPRTGEAGDT